MRKWTQSERFLAEVEAALPLNGGLPPREINAILGHDVSRISIRHALRALRQQGRVEALGHPEAYRYIRTQPNVAEA